MYNKKETHLSSKNHRKTIFKHSIVWSVVLTIILATVSVGATFNPTQQKAHQVANIAREMNLPESDPIIVKAQQVWWEEELKKEDLDTQDSVVDGSSEIVWYYTTNDAEMMANVIYHESRGIPSDTELACVGWIICNRYDAGYGTFKEIITAPSQFAYIKNAYMSTESYNRCYRIASDVLYRWNLEKNGYTDVGRVLPIDYRWFNGKNGHNWFRNVYSGSSARWDYSLESPYAS